MGIKQYIILIKKSGKKVIIQMQEVIDYNFLIIGRSGSGKSATSKLLTGDPSITVANSINEVTKQVRFYQGVSHCIGSKQVRFGILDIPGLDRIDNRFILREVMLEQLEKLGILLHGILYIASLTERDTVDQAKLFNFVDQLPWTSQAKKSCIIPILTKYDNFIFDSPQQDIARTKQQFHKLFLDKGYGTAWSKRIYWVNFTKSLDFKIKHSEDIREKYQGQLDRLVEMIRKNKKVALTAQSIKQYIKKQDKYVLQHFLQKLSKNQIPYTLHPKSHKIPLHIKLEPSKVNESLTAFSASSIGIFIARVFKHDIPLPISLIMMGIPITLTFVNLMCEKSGHSAEKIGGGLLDWRVIGNFGRICGRINQELEEEWRMVNKDIQFSIQGKYLKCTLHKNTPYKFFSLQNSELQQQQKHIQFEHRDLNLETSLSTYTFPIPSSPSLTAEGVWDPIVSVKYEIKVFDQHTVMKVVEGLRADFNIHFG